MDLVVGGIADDYTGRLTAVRADITRCPAATDRYGITGAPSCVLLKEGEAVVHGTGSMTITEVRKFLDGHLWAAAAARGRDARHVSSMGAASPETPWG
ncbi:hypothetical protein GCM10023084_81090 [Streptomyces lacrimifluminis]|uniref:Thioredoxin n=1 Tax=Streptomyces lacrimifluminis TaxID=1500077 RepID=A0A917UND6_9ACTN|nr:hypothetical protein GCM10012282_78350 [Streptomyces lacrimifluminis]